MRKEERSWKNFRLDKNKVYIFIGKAFLYLLFNLGLSLLLYFGFLQNTIY